MKQRTLAPQSGFERYGKKTRRAEFLEQMELVVPWGELCALIEPVYPKAGQGRPPVGLGRQCDRERVRGAGLWNSDYVDKPYDPAFPDQLEALASQTGHAG